ncbi:hypothetical protein [Nocardioides bruguierae]|uniref:hypothetical protein n=1 Tax=Nocardioides bruguierae TaxID=2945102 RepID=UPI0020225C73|nr:hypothetical protein [Nocardioides bruguierae]MCL8026331.1 hypothetical protein [Nocardioides bruguierae]
MKVYLAGPYAARSTLHTYAAELEPIGIEVTSSWLKETHEITPGTEKAATDLTDDEVSAHARMDIADVRTADLLVLFTAASVGCEGGGGRHIETGMAIALSKPVLVVGEPENVFHRMGSPVFVFPDWHATLIDLARRHAAPRQHTFAGRSA